MIIFPNGRRTTFNNTKPSTNPNTSSCEVPSRKDRLFLVGRLVIDGVLSGQYLKDFQKPFLRIRAHFNVDVAQGGRRGPVPGRSACAWAIGQGKVAIFPQKVIEAIGSGLSSLQAPRTSAGVMPNFKVPKP